MFMSLYRKNNHCRVCRSTELVKFISLGRQPLANSFLRKTELNRSESRYPLEVYFCKHCNFVQLLHVVDRNTMFRNYVYFTSGMPKISDHYRSYALSVMKRYMPQGGFTVEIGSNDGILLKFFQDSGCRVLGIDPAKNIVKVAEANGVKSICDFFGPTVARKVVDRYGHANALLANNVVAHIDDLHGLCEGVKILLDKNGVFVFEAPYLLDMFENLTYDTIYHEHLSYLAVRPLQRLFSEYNLEIFDAEIVPVQGKSLRAFVGHKGNHHIKTVVEQMVRNELKSGLNRLLTYTKLAKRIANSRDNLIKLMLNLKKKGEVIAGYGAPAKGNTLLNYCHIGSEILDYCLEDLPSKHNLYTPGTHIPVVNRDYAINHVPNYYLLLAWNYRKPILKKERKFLKDGGHFIVPVGDKIEIIQDI